MTYDEHDIPTDMRAQAKQYRADAGREPSPISTTN